MNKDAAPVAPETATDTQSTLNFKLLNNITGWVVFVISLIVYLMTVERTASFWDCGEFIACAYKLQVPHPPGAPFFLLTGRIFSFLAGGDVTMVAYWINMVSVLSSAFTILFLFWTITLFGVKLFPGKTLKTLDNFQIITLLGGGLIGSLAYTFSDSFWFSAVEAEVYAMSSFFTAFVVWAMLKWELIEDNAVANKWLILIAYMMGLSIGVHLLNLVTIPALGLLYYYKKYEEPSLKGVFTTLLVSGAIIILILEGVIPGLPSYAGQLEIFMVNTFGAPFGTGIILFSIGFLALLIYGVYYSNTKDAESLVEVTRLVPKALKESLKTDNRIFLPLTHANLNTAFLSLTFILIGYSTYGIILIRSNYNPPINENDPSNIIKFVSYLKREQYGDRPLIYGPTFNSEVKRDSEGRPVRKSKGKLYRMDKENGKYMVYDERFDYEFKDNMLLPRIYSRSADHQQLYMQRIYGGRNNDPNTVKPNMSDNLYFLFTYQFGTMYWRYFLWNFAGREGDFEGARWLSPFDSSSNLPQELANNKGRNQFFMLPLLLGIIGLVFVYQRSQQTFFITMMLFFLTGLALVLYLNSPPVEPRERDYIYAGSYYAFAMWIGFGVFFLADLIRERLKNPMIAPMVATLLCLVVPGIMAYEGWDDHNRANRYHSIDSAKNLLESCAPNAILFTGGDNDTFPLWYVQEVEGYRTDVRVCNLSLLGTDWYISQMKRKTYKSDSLPITMKEENYLQGTNDQILYPKAWRISTNFSSSQLDKLAKNGMDIKAYIDLVNKNDERVKAFAPGDPDDVLSIFPSQKMVLKIDKDEVINMGIVPQDKENLMSDLMSWTIQRNDLFKNHLIMLDMIANNDWKRPIYFSSTLANSNYLNLQEYMQVEGLAYRLLPVKVPGASRGFVNPDIMFENLTTKFHYRELNNPNTFHDENYRRFVLNLRDSFSRMAQQYLSDGNEEKAKESVMFCLEKMPDESIPLDVYSTQLIEILIKVGEKDKANEIAGKMSRRADEMLDYLLDQKSYNEREVRINFAILGSIVRIFNDNGNEDLAKQYEAKLEKHYRKAERR